MYTLLCKAREELRTYGCRALIRKIISFLSDKTSPFINQFYLVRDIGTANQEEWAAVASQLRVQEIVVEIVQDESRKEEVVDWLRHLHRFWSTRAGEIAKQKAACILGLCGGERCYVSWISGMEQSQSVPERVKRFLPRRSAYLWGLYVPKAFRRRGIATLIGQYLLPFLAQQGYDSLAVGVHRNNVPSLKTHVRQGFRPVVYCCLLKIRGAKWCIRIEADPQKLHAALDAALRNA